MAELVFSGQPRGLLHYRPRPCDAIAGSSSIDRLEESSEVSNREGAVARGAGIDDCLLNMRDLKAQNEIDVGELGGANPARSVAREIDPVPAGELDCLGERRHVNELQGAERLRRDRQPFR